jgi:hypothetical protein
LDLAIAIPTGIPMTMQVVVATSTIAIVFIASSHIPNTPIAMNANIVPITILTLRDPSQAKPDRTIIKIGQGVLDSRFSNQIKNQRSGLNRLSNAAPYSPTKLLKEPSIALRIELN